MLNSKHLAHDLRVEPQLVELIYRLKTASQPGLRLSSPTAEQSPVQLGLLQHCTAGCEVRVRRTREPEQLKVQDQDSLKV